VLLITLVMLRRVAIAVACIKVASQAVSTMPSILLFPLLPFVLEVCWDWVNTFGLTTSGLVVLFVGCAFSNQPTTPTPTPQQPHPNPTPIPTHPHPNPNPQPQVGLIIYWVAVAAVLYSAGVPTAHWRDAAEFKPLGLDQLSFTNDSAPTMAARPDTTNLTGYVSGAWRCRGLLVLVKQANLYNLEYRLLAV